MTDLNEAMAAIEARYQEKFDAIKREGVQLGEDAPDPNAVEAVINVDFDLGWKEREFIFSLPSVTMKNRDIKVSIPEVSKSRQTISFDVPEMRMETYCAFKKPEIHGPTIKWKCVYLDKPVLRMVTKKIIFDLPSVTMKLRTISLKLPEVTMREHRIVLNLPTITVRNIKVETRRLEARGDDLSRRAQKLADEMEAEIRAIVPASLGEAGAGEMSAENAIAGEYDRAIAELEAAIADLVARKVDPIKVPTDDGDVNLRKELSDLRLQREQAIAELKKGHEPLPLAA